MEVFQIALRILRWVVPAVYWEYFRSKIATFGPQGLGDHFGEMFGANEDSL